MKNTIETRYWVALKGVPKGPRRSVQCRDKKVRTNRQANIQSQRGNGCLKHA